MLPDRFSSTPVPEPEWIATDGAAVASMIAGLVARYAETPDAAAKAVGLRRIAQAEAAIRVGNIARAETLAMAALLYLPSAQAAALHERG